MKLASRFLRLLKTLIVWLLMLALFDSSANIAAQGKGVVPNQLVALSQLNQGKQFSGNFVRQLGFTNGEIAIFEDVKGILDNTGSIVLWDVRNRRVKKTLSFSPWIDNYDLVLSDDGQWLATNNNPMAASFPHAKTYRLTVMRTSDFGIVKTRNYDEREDSGGLLFLPHDSQHIVVAATSLVLYKGVLDYGPSRLDWFNLTTGKVDKTLPYGPASGLSRLIDSPDRKYLLGLFYSEAFHPYGYSDYFKDQMDRHAFADVIDAKTGKILWHIAGTDKQPVGDPLFFISPTRFIASDTVFNIATKTARPWNAVTASRHCLGAVPGHSNYALFLTKQGLQLRNWQTDRALVTWPTITKLGRILFSPDLKTFSFKRGQIIQFWQFDPQWLR